MHALYGINRRGRHPYSRCSPAKQSAKPWRMMIAARNRLIHGYLGIDNDTLWSIINTDIPALLPQLQQLQKQNA